MPRAKESVGTRNPGSSGSSSSRGRGRRCSPAGSRARGRVPRGRAAPAAAPHEAGAPSGWAVQTAGLFLEKKARDAFEIREKNGSGGQTLRGDREGPGGGGQRALRIGRMCCVRVSGSKGKVLVDIREFCVDEEGDVKPRRKGIALSGEQWNQLKEIVPEVDAALKKL